MEQTKLEANYCPWENCEKLLDAASGPGVPGPGDISVCFGCVRLLIFNDEMILECLTPEKYDLLPEDVKWEINKYKLAIERVNAERRSTIEFN